MNNNFTLVDIKNWDRRSEYEFFIHGATSFNMTFKVDITPLYEYVKKNKLKFYPTIISAFSKAINSFDCFKYSYDSNDNLVKYEVVHPSFCELDANYNVKGLIAEYNEDLMITYQNILAVREEYKDINDHSPQKDSIRNIYSISIIPWEESESVSFDLQNCESVLFPIITFGKFVNIGGKIIIPISVYVNHKVCDGYHVSNLITKFKEVIKDL